MFKAKVVDKGASNWDKIVGSLSKNYDIFVGLPNTGQRYPYKSYEYGPQKFKGAKKQSPKAPTDISDSSKPLPLVAEVGFWNEFGTADGRIPERSFLRATVVANTPKYISLNIKVVQRVMKQTLDLKQGLQRIGLIAENDVKDAIKQFNSPPNAPSTIRQKGVNAPLKYKGTLQQSIRSFVKRR